jgi:hypothetical protein
MSVAVIRYVSSLMVLTIGHSTRSIEESRNSIATDCARHFIALGFTTATSPVWAGCDPRPAQGFLETLRLIRNSSLIGFSSLFENPTVGIAV